MVRSHQWPRVAGLVWFCMAWLFLASYKGSIPDQSFAMGSSRCGLRRRRTPCRAASWISVQDIKEIYTTEEFEKQVYASLDGGDDLLRLPFYEIQATEDDVQKAKGAFESGFATQPGFNWNTGRKGKLKKKGVRGAAQASNPQCDLYLKKDAPPMHVATLFRHTCFKNVSLSGVASRWEDLTASVVLAEIAQTPASLRNKLWQLERAMRFGPQEIQQPGCCLVCINGEGAEFELAANLAATGLQQLGGGAKLNSVPVFAIWTPYRNVYASILDLRNNIDELKNDTAKIDAKIDETNAKIDAKIDETNAKIDELKTEIQTMQQAIIAAISKG